REFVFGGLLLSLFDRDHNIAKKTVRSSAFRRPLLPARSPTVRSPAFRRLYIGGHFEFIFDMRKRKHIGCRILSAKEFVQLLHPPDRNERNGKLAADRFLDRTAQAFGKRRESLCIYLYFSLEIYDHLSRAPCMFASSESCECSSYAFTIIWTSLWRTTSLSLK